MKKQIIVLLYFILASTAVLQAQIPSKNSCTMTSVLETTEAFSDTGGIYIPCLSWSPTMTEAKMNNVSYILKTQRYHSNIIYIHSKRRFHFLQTRLPAANGEKVPGEMFFYNNVIPAGMKISMCLFYSKADYVILDFIFKCFQNFINLCNLSNA